MRLTTHLTTTTALVVSLATAPLSAQETDSKTSETQTQTTQTDSGENTNAGSDGASSNDASSANVGEDMVVVRVGDTDILGSDISGVISLLPPQLQQQPPEMLVPMAVNQLIARELILKAAIAENLAEDPEVVALVDEAKMASEQDAMVQIWLDRELSGQVTDAEIQAKYEEIKAATDQDIPPLDAVRDQIEIQLRQEAFAGIQENLRKDVIITYYGPDGNPQAASSD
jgi:hypothetical protein